MSSGFVSGGTADAPIERDEEWLAAQKEIENNRRIKQEQARRQGGRSLFETLEANKAAKEEAFTEANRLKNQFRALDEDEVEWLDGVLESTRREEERVKRETREGLEVFRKRQEEVDKNKRGSGDEVVERGGEEWKGGGKRKRNARGKGELRGVKIRRVSGVGSEGGGSLGKEDAVVGKEDTHTDSTGKVGPTAAGVVKKDQSSPKATPIPKSPEVEKTISTPVKPKGGLVDYGSDDDDW